MPSQRSNRDRLGRTPVFRREGDYWTIPYDTAVVRLKDAKRLRYLEPLLRHPGRSFHVAELIRLTAYPEPRSGRGRRNSRSHRAHPQSCHQPHPADAGADHQRPRYPRTPPAQRGPHRNALHLHA